MQLFTMAQKPTMNDGLVRWTMQEARKLTGDSAWSGDSERMNKPLELLVSVISSPSNPTKPVPPAEPKQNQNAASISISRSDDRDLISLATLETAIADTVRRSAPGCEAFVGVIVQRTKPKSHFGANWALRGIRFGKTDRDKANVAITTIVERMQREFWLSDD
jgi:hypothetical protein